MRPLGFCTYGLDVGAHLLTVPCVHALHACHMFTRLLPLTLLPWQVLCAPIGCQEGKCAKRSQDNSIGYFNDEFTKPKMVCVVLQAANTYVGPCGFFALRRHALGGFRVRV